MESLLSEFGNLKVAGSARAHRNPYLGPDDPMPGSLVLKHKPGGPDAWKQICEMRWPDAPTVEKTVLETRLGKSLTWKQVPELLDQYMERWADQKRRKHCQLQEFGVSRIVHRNKGRSRIFDNMTVISLAVNEYYAAALSTVQGSETVGTLWVFPVVHFENSTKAEWLRTGITFAAYHASFMIGSTLYVVDGTRLSAANLSEQTQVYSIDILEKFSISLAKAEMLRVSLHGVIAVLLADGSVVAFYENATTQSVELLLQLPRPSESVSYTAITVDSSKILTGRSDGLVELWYADGEVMKCAETLDLFEAKASDHDLRPLKIVPHDPVTGIYSRGRRLMVHSRHNRVSLEHLAGRPITMLDENAKVPVVYSAVMGDLAGVLYANGVVELSCYSGTRPYYIHSFPQTALPIVNYIQIGEQRLAVLGDMAIVLSQSGRLYTLNLNELKAPGSTSDPAAPVKWSPEEEQLLEAALKKYPKTDSQRWDKIAAEMPGKTKADCLARFKYNNSLKKAGMAQAE